MNPSRRPLTALFGTVIALLVIQLEVSAQPRSKTSLAGAPNIIFVLADDQGWNGTSVQMHPDLPDSKSDFYHTPNLERLADRGMRFSQAYSPGPMCSPTRASLQTGKSPAQLRMTNVGGGRQPTLTPTQRLIPPPHFSNLPTKEVTVGEMLKRAGYATAWFGKWHLGSVGPKAHGYDESDGPTGNAEGNTGDPSNPKDIFGITNRGIDFMERSVGADKPFYLQLWHYAVHGPVQAKPETEKAYAKRTPGRTHQSASFAGMTEDLDVGVGMIMDKIEELGISDKTYVIYMSDHGAGRNLSSNAPLNQGKGTLWEGGLRVPMIVSGPGVKSGAFCNIPTVGWDLFPTFCDLAGIDGNLPQHLEGQSLTPLFKTGKIKPEEGGRQIAFHFPHYGQAGPQSTLIRDGYKLIKFYDTNELRLFDLGRDIGERQDLSQVHPDKVGFMHQALIDYLMGVNAGIPTANPDFDPNLVAQAVGPVGGPRGRRRPGRDQIAERQKKLAILQRALKQKDMETVGQLLAEMIETLSDVPSRRQRPVGNTAGSPRQRLQQELIQLNEVYNQGDVKKLGELITQIQTRLTSNASRAPTRSRINSRGQTDD